MKRLTEEEIRQTVEAAAKSQSAADAARMLGISRTTFLGRMDAARRSGANVQFNTSKSEDLSKEELLSIVDGLKAELQAARKASAPTLDEAIVRSKIIQLTKMPVHVPNWVTKPESGPSVTGVPTLLASDWHWGEVVSRQQVNGVNEFNLEIAHRRAQRLIERTMDLCFSHIANPAYPGVVFALAGDMVSGNIHDELEATNEKPIMPVVVDLIGVLSRCILQLADKFGRVFVPAVTGNHGRFHRKVRFKDRAYESFDWLIYSILAKRFEEDDRVSFLIPDSADCTYSVYGHRYTLTHGDQFRGGDGMIGMLGPVTRGDLKKRARNAQIDLEYDTLLIGHWHQLHMGNRVIVNGSLKGFCEYAYANNFGFELPQQALWITHPREGITFRMEVHLEPRQYASKEWVST